MSYTPVKRIMGQALTYLVLLEAEDPRWLKKNQLYDVRWLPADVRLIIEIEI